MTVTHNGKQYTAKKLNDNEWQLTSVSAPREKLCLTAGRCISLAS
jgi:hypothetical protein